MTNKSAILSIDPTEWRALVRRSIADRSAISITRSTNARRVQINGVDCRMVEDTLLDMVIEAPDVITHR
jgi:hypothetical protein